MRRAPRLLTLTTLTVCAVAWLVVAGCGAAHEAASAAVTPASDETGALGSQASDTTSTVADAEHKDGGAKVYYRAKGSRVNDMTVHSLRELEDRSKAIARVTVLDTLQRGTRGPGAPKFGVHLTKVMAQEVFKSDGRMKEGSTYTVTEYYTTEPHPDRRDTTIFWVIDDNVPMEVGGEYILFLVEASHPELGDYEVYGLWWGQYKVSDKIRQTAEIKNLTKEDIGAAHDYNGSDYGYWAIAQEVKDKYLSGE